MTENNLSEKSFEALKRAKETHKLIKWESLINDNSFESKAALQLADDVRNGKFKVPESELPVDFHQFYGIFKDGCKEIVSRDLINEEFGITHDWAFNCMVSNYPTISFSEHFKHFFSIINNDTTYLPSSQALRQLLDYYLQYDNPQNDLTCNRPILLQNDYAKWISENKIFRNYKLGDKIENKKISKLFFEKDLIYTISNILVRYNKRLYYPLVPLKLVSDYDNSFKMNDFLIVI
jgi:hypothetical protein